MSAKQMPNMKFLLSYIKSVIICLLMMKSSCETSLCQKNEVVLKTRTRLVYKTYSESYTDYYCHHYNYRWHSCTKNRLKDTYVTEEQDYTELKTKEFCCPGYIETDDSSERCSPVCDFECLHGKCTAPNNCKCHEGYSMRSGTENICEPVCSETCVNGYCTEPEVCSCNMGYEIDPSLQYTCRAICNPTCVNAECIAPNTCKCSPGHVKVMEDPHKCHAHCSEPCHNAVCTKPDVCSCVLGYTKDNYNMSVCNPVCSQGCVNGTCTGPNECTCFDGFNLVGNYYTCEPICTNCLNAFCSAPEVCTCFQGYEKDINDEAACWPVCSPECVNSNCTAPDSCECFSGFEETDNPVVCRPYCSDGCRNGLCTEPEVCTCLWGYQSEGNSTSNCSLSASERHKCSFVNQIRGHDFNRSCIKISGELSLKKLKDCDILQKLMARLLKNQNKVSIINLKCDRVSYLRKFKSYIDLELFCHVTFNNEEHELKIGEDITRTLSYTDDIDDLTTDFPVTNDFIITDTVEEFETKSVSVDTLEQTKEKNELEITTEQSKKDSMTQEEFKIIFGNSLNESIQPDKLSDFPLHLSINLQFLMLIKSKQITQGYFHYNNASVNQEWCLCNRNQIRRICASMQTQLFLCPCKPKKLRLKLEDDSRPFVTFLFLVISLLSVLLLVLSIIYGLKQLKRIGSYSTSGKEVTGLGAHPILSTESLSSSEGNVTELS